MAEEKDRNGKEKGLVEYEADGEIIKLTPKIVKQFLVNGRRELVTDQEVMMFMALCKYRNLNPWTREAYLIKYSERDAATTVVGKDTFVKRAATNPECAGYNAGVIVEYKKGNRTEREKRVGSAVFEGETLVGGWGRAMRKGWTEPLEIEVSLKEYMRYNAKKEPNRSWREMPGTMIRKVGLIQALRETFPEKYSQMYTPEEMPIEPGDLPDEPLQQPKEEREALPVREEDNGDTIMHDDGTVEKLPQPEDASQEELGIF